MNNYTIDCYEVKNYLKELNKSAVKFLGNMQCGLSKGKSCLITEIARSLNEIINTFLDKEFNLYENNGIIDTNIISNL